MKPKTESALFYLEWCNLLLASSRNDEGRYEKNSHRLKVENTYKKAIEFYKELLKKSKPPHSS
jgi:hypothetical protein